MHRDAPHPIILGTREQHGTSNTLMATTSSEANSSAVVSSSRRYLICSIDYFAGFAHATTTYVAGVALADLHGMQLIYQPLKTAHGVGYLWDDFFAADPRGLVPPIAAPALSYANHSGRIGLLVDGRSVRLQQLLQNAGPHQIARMLGSSKPDTVTWIRKGRGTYPPCTDGCEILAEIQHAGLWLRERFWQAVHARARRRAMATSTAVPGTSGVAGRSLAASYRLRTSDERRGDERRGGGNRSDALAARAAAAANATTVAIHVRRGDVTWLDRYGKPSHRWVETTSVVDVLDGLKTILQVPELSPRHGVRVSLYSEAGWLANDTAAVRRVAPHASVHTDSSPAATVAAMIAMASADILLLGSSGFSTFAGLFSCGLKIGGADTGMLTRANLTLPLRHVFFATSLTARSTPFLPAVGAKVRAVWSEYAECKRDSTCRRTRLCSAGHLSDARWARSRLAQRAIADPDGMQWRPPPPQQHAHARHTPAPSAAAAAPAAATRRGSEPPSPHEGAALEAARFAASAAKGSPALRELWTRACKATADGADGGAHGGADGVDGDDSGAAGAGAGAGVGAGPGAGAGAGGATAAASQTSPRAKNKANKAKGSPKQQPPGAAVVTHACLRQSWGKNVSSWLSLRRLVPRGANSAA